MTASKPQPAGAKPGQPSTSEQKAMAADTLTQAVQHQARVRKQLTPAEQAKRDAERAAKFQEIASRRVRGALTVLGRLETVGRSPSYRYTPEQAARLVAYLEEAIEKVKLAFAGRIARKEFQVRL